MFCKTLDFQVKSPADGAPLSQVLNYLAVLQLAGCFKNVWWNIDEGELWGALRWNRGEGKLNTFMHADTHRMPALTHPKIWWEFSPILGVISSPFASFIFNVILNKLLTEGLGHGCFSCKSPSGLWGVSLHLKASLLSAVCLTQIVFPL